MPFGPHEAIDGAHLWARPGGSRVEDPLRGAIWKFENFRKKFLFPVSRRPYHHRSTGCPRTRNPAQPPGGYRLAARAPKDAIFADYNWRILRKSPFYFRLISHVDTLSSGAFSAIFRMGSKGVRTPPKSTPKKFPFLCTHFWPTWSAPTKILALTECVGGHAPYPTLKRARGYLPPVRRYGVPKIWHNVGGGPVSTERFAGGLSSRPLTPFGPMFACAKNYQNSTSRFWDMGNMVEKPHFGHGFFRDYAAKCLVWRRLSAAFTVRSGSKYRVR